jgi:hypothetical protein
VDLYGQYNSKLNDKKVIVGWIGNGSHYEEELIWFVNEIVTPLTKHYLETPLQFCFIGVKNCNKLFSLIESLKLTDKFAMIEDLNWSDTQEKAFNDLKLSLTSAPIFATTQLQITIHTLHGCVVTSRRGDISTERRRRSRICGRLCVKIA